MFTCFPLDLCTRKHLKDLGVLVKQVFLGFEPTDKLSTKIHVTDEQKLKYYFRFTERCKILICPFSICSIGNIAIHCCNPSKVYIDQL